MTGRMIERGRTAVKYSVYTFAIYATIVAIPASVTAQETTDVTFFGLKMGSLQSENKFKLLKPLTMNKRTPMFSCEATIRSDSGSTKMTGEQDSSFEYNYAQTDTSLAGRLSGGWYETESLGKKMKICMIYFDDKLYYIHASQNANAIKEAIDLKYSQIKTGAGGASSGTVLITSYSLPGEISVRYTSTPYITHLNIIHTPTDNSYSTEASRAYLQTLLQSKAGLNNF
jgi:hypothetical protein